MKHLSLIVLLLLCVWFGYSCLDYRTDRNAVAQVGETRITLADLQKHLNDTLVYREQAHAAIARWIEMQVFYEEAIARGLHEEENVKRLLRDAQVKILQDQLWLRVLSNTPEPSSEEQLEFYLENTHRFLRNTPAYEVGLLSTSNGKEIWEWRDAIAKTSFVALAEKLQNQGRTVQVRPPSPQLAQDLPGCFVADLPTIKEGQTLMPRKCGEDGFIILHLYRRHNAGDALPLEQVRDRVVRMVQRQNAEKLMDELLEQAKSRQAVFTFPEKLRHLPLANAESDSIKADTTARAQGAEELP